MSTRAGPPPRGLPLAVVVGASSAFLVIAAAVLVGWLTSRNGERAVGEVARRLRTAAAERIDDHLDVFLEPAQRLNAQNAADIAAGRLDAGSMEALQGRFLEEVRATPTVTSIYFGSPGGGLAGAGREGAEGSFYFTGTVGFRAGEFVKRRVDDPAAAPLATVRGFDTRTRPWYTAAVASGGSAWSPPYVLATRQDMALAASAPVLSPSGTLLGVVSIDLFLGHLGTFLSSLDVGETGQAFIVERTGLLVASSTGTLPFRISADGRTARIAAADSGIPLIRDAAALLAGTGGALADLAQRRSWDARIAGRRSFVTAAPYGADWGLDWIVVVAIPESDFMAAVTRGSAVTFAVTACVALAAATLGFAAARRITRPLRALAAFAGDHATRDVPRMEGGVREVRILSGALARIYAEIEAKSRQLTAYASGLEEKVRERTRSLEASNAELARALEDLQRAHSRLVQSEKMASIGQLAAGIAHEINNPMAYIKSNLSTMERYVGKIAAFIDGALAGEDPAALAAAHDIGHVREDVGALVAESLEGSRRVQAIVSSLKDFAHVDTGEVSRVDIGSLIDATLQVAWNQVKYKADVRRKYAVLPPVRCYAQRINQVLLNVILNAAQAIDRKGTITITTALEGDSVTVCIRDDGAGMTPEVQSRIFEPFFTTKPVGKGTGLGLSVSWEIVHSHGGEIRVESEPGRGSAFTIVLPVEPVFAEEKSADKGDAP